MRLEYTEDWPDCAEQGCEHKACLMLDSHLCFVHTAGDADDKRRLIKEKRIELGYD